MQAKFFFNHMSADSACIYLLILHKQPALYFDVCHCVKYKITRFLIQLPALLQYKKGGKSSQTSSNI
jgi:hypothetical protein